MNSATVFVGVIVIGPADIPCRRYYWSTYGKRQVTDGCVGDEVAVIRFSEDKKLADINVGCLEIEYPVEWARNLPSGSRGLARAFGGGDTSSFTAARLPAGGNGSVPKYPVPSPKLST